MADEPKQYLDYLDKEMTIMGVLSAFDIAEIALVVSKFGGAADKSALATIWQCRLKYILSGSTALLLSALFFYRQRSLLAWYYGQICLSLQKGSKPGSTQKRLSDADSWTTWINYRWAFGFLTYGFLQYAIAIGGDLFPCIVGARDRWTIISPVITVVLICSILSLILWRFPDSEDPYKDAWGIPPWQLFVKPPPTSADKEPEKAKETTDHNKKKSAKV